MEDRWNAPDLSGKVAVVAGGTRGVGRGIAEVLGACKATVYVTGRTTRASPTPGNPDWTIEAVAEEINKQGGAGIPVRCDHTDDTQVEALFNQMRRDHGGLDILVNNLVGWSFSEGESSSSQETTYQFIGLPIWDQPIQWWDANMLAGVRAHVVNCRYGIPLMLERKNGLVLFTSERPDPDPSNAYDMVLDMRGQATERLVALLAIRLQLYNIASILLYPGYTRTEDIVKQVEAGTYPLVGSMDELVEKTVSPRYSGRAAAMLAADPNVLDNTGKVVTAAECALRYDFTDTDGRQPDPR